VGTGVEGNQRAHRYLDLPFLQSAAVFENPVLRFRRGLLPKKSVGLKNPAAARLENLGSALSNYRVRCSAIPICHPVLRKAKTMSKRRNGQLALRIEPELRDAIETAADQERRPMSSLIRCILEDWVRARPSSNPNAGAH
jgi:hypothetical protein